jgi:hypothetical protein
MKTPVLRFPGLSATLVPAVILVLAWAAALAQPATRPPNQPVREPAMTTTTPSSSAASSAAAPISIHPDNPHYFLFRGRPAVLVTSAEHYGAVVNKDFDYVKYLDWLKSYGLNYTRIYPGAMFEPRDKFVAGNTLAPKPESLIVPWARSDQPGFALGGNKFDLSKWDAEYFKRYRSFLAEAGRRGIVVEICFFNCQYEDTWPLSPLFHKNNVQGVGDCHFNDAQTLKHPALAKAEEEYVRKLTQEARDFDNVILEICDEPILLGTPSEQAGAWIARMIETIRSAENDMTKPHLIAQQVEGRLGGPCDFSGDPNVGLIVTQYVWEAGGEQLGGMQGLETEYGHNKPIELNETNYYPIWYKGDKIGDSRVEAWEFIVGGGAGFNQLNGLYTAANPAGDTPDNVQLCGALRNLLAFMNGFDFVKMRRDVKTVAGGVPKGALCRCISEPGRQYAIYLHHSTGEKGAAYEVQPGDYRAELILDLPAGTYRAEWTDPATGRVAKSETFAHGGGKRSLASPAYRIDIALSVKLAVPIR